MRKISLVILLVVGIILTAGGLVPVLAADSPPLMTIETLRETLQEPGLVILDVRRGKDWTSSQHKIPGAVYNDPGEYEKLTQTYSKDTKIVAYCA